jgi:Cu-processing system permease protein
MTAILTIASREVLVGLRSRWVLATTLLLAALALSLAFLGSAPIGRVGVTGLEVVVVSLASLTVFLMPLIALLISHDAISGEAERGTLPLLLSYPVARWQIILGKFAGHGMILIFATALGYGAAAAALALTGAEIAEDGLAAFGGMIGSSILLGAVFVAIGYCISALARDRSAAAALAIGVWLALVLIFDMALLGLLVFDQGRTISAGALNVVLLFNPTDVYRLFNLSGFADVSRLAGMSGLAAKAAWSKSALLLALLAWIAVPLGIAATTFARREI